MIYIGIGSNLGDRMSNLRKALSLLNRYLTDMHPSIIVETEAILPESAPDDWNKPFLNMVVRGKTELDPDELLKSLKQIECEIGRTETYEKWSPRVIDLDILLYKDQVVTSPHLTMPHPELCNRFFFLHLIALLNPLLKHPQKNLTFSDLADKSPYSGKSLVLSPQLVGIVNITPDSFSDGGLYLESEKAIQKSYDLVSEGASVIDLGAQSTRPGSQTLDAKSEYTNLKPVLDGLKNIDARISVDTFWPEIILQIIDNHPISWINDVKGNLDDETLRAVAKSGCSYVTMHSLSIPPRKENRLPSDVTAIQPICEWAEKSIERLLKLGFKQESIILDPGIGFGKSTYQSLELTRCAQEMKKFGCPLLFGHSRKSYLAPFTSPLPAERDLETIAVSRNLQQSVDYLRVHNVKDHQRFFVAEQVTL